MGLRTAPFPVADEGMTYVLIRLFDCWGGFSRALALSLPLGPRNRLGVPISLSKVAPPTQEGLIVLAWSVARSPRRIKTPIARRLEPDWAEPALLADLAFAIGASNELSFRAVSNTFADDLRIVRAARNFFAHKHGETAGEFQALAGARGLTPAPHPTNTLRLKTSSGSPVLIEELLHRMEQAALALSS
jgi:hypothetical protein